MQIIAESKNVKISPRKVRLVAEGIKHYSIPQAIQMLHGLNKRAAVPVRKVIESAMANAVNNLKLSKDDLAVKEIMVNEGIVYKRYHFAARGRVRPYKRRTSNIRVVLSTKSEARNPKSKEGLKKQSKSEENK